MNDEVFERYKEETDILCDDKSELVIIYGSRATEDYKNSSDLDILVVVPGEDGHLRREKRFIDGISVETIFLSKSTLMKKIKEEYWINSKFLESALTTGTVKKSLNGIYISALDEIKRLNEIKKDKQSFSIYWAEELDKILYQYRHSEGNEKKLYYFLFINVLRRIYHIMNNYSEITDWKFYQLYTNKEKARLYRLDLPDEEFIDAMIKAVNPDNMDESLENLFSFVGCTDYEKEKRSVVISKNWRKFLSKFDTDKRLMYLGKNVVTVEDMLLTERKEADCCYFLLLDYIEDNIWYIGPKDRSEFDKIFQRALDALGVEERIRVLEELLHEIDKEYDFDYDDYSL